MDEEIRQKMLEASAFIRDAYRSNDSPDAWVAGAWMGIQNVLEFIDEKAKKREGIEHPCAGALLALLLSVSENLMNAMNVAEHHDLGSLAAEHGQGPPPGAQMH